MSSRTYLIHRNFELIQKFRKEKKHKSLNNVQLSTINGKTRKNSKFSWKPWGWGLRPNHKFCRTEAEPNTSAEPYIRSYTSINSFSLLQIFSMLSNLCITCISFIFFWQIRNSSDLWIQSSILLKIHELSTCFNLWVNFSVSESKAEFTCSSFAYFTFHKQKNL